MLTWVEVVIKEFKEEERSPTDGDEDYDFGRELYSHVCDIEVLFESYDRQEVDKKSQ
jgi:hypothetical protein